MSERFLRLTPCDKGYFAAPTQIASHVFYGLCNNELSSSFYILISIPQTLQRRRNREPNVRFGSAIRANLWRLRHK